MILFSFPFIVYDQVFEVVGSHELVPGIKFHHPAVNAGITAMVPGGKKGDLIPGEKEDDNYRLPQSIL